VAGKLAKHHAMVVRSPEPYNAGPPLPVVRASFLTPVEVFFVRNHGTIPIIDPAAYRLSVSGLVDRPLDLSLDALRDEFTPVTLAATIQCAGNRRSELMALRPIAGEIPWDAEAIGTARWTGVRLAEVLRASSVRPDARHVQFSGLDRVIKENRVFGFGGSIPLEKATGGEVLLAYEMNGMPLPPVHGFPLRVVVPGYIGARSVKWLGGIVLAAEPSSNYFQSHAYKLFPPHVQAQTADWATGLTLAEPPVHAVICAPQNGQRVPAGRVSVTGYAFAGGGRPIAQVDVSADGGGAWEAARLVGEAQKWTWQFWEAEVQLSPGRAQIAVRSRDAVGGTQRKDLEAVWNFKGYVNNAWHRITVNVGKP